MMNYLEKNLNEQRLEQQKAERDSLFSTCALVNGEIYAFTCFKRLPIKKNLQTGEITILKNVKNYDLSFVPDGMLSVGHDIFVLELNGNRLLKYNTNENTCQYFYIDCNRKEWDNYAAFAQYGEYLYIIPRFLDELIKIEICSGKVQRDKKIHFKENGENFGKPWYGFQGEKVIWFFEKESNRVISYDMEKDVWENYELSVTINDCVHAVLYNNRMYILSSEGNIYGWNTENKLLEKIADCSNESKDGNIFYRIAITDKIIFVLPGLGQDIFCIDKNTKEISKYKSYPNDFRYLVPEGWSKYYGYCEDEDYYYFAMRSMNFILSLNKNSGEEQWIKSQLPTCQEYKNFYATYNKALLNENELDIDGLLCYLNSESIIGKNMICKLAGNQVWKRVKGETK